MAEQTNSIDLSKINQFQTQLYEYIKNKLQSDTDKRIENFNESRLDPINYNDNDYIYRK